MISTSSTPALACISKGKGSFFPGAEQGPLPGGPFYFWDRRPRESPCCTAATAHRKCARIITYNKALTSSCTGLLGTRPKRILCEPESFDAKAPCHCRIDRHAAAWQQPVPPPSAAVEATPQAKGAPLQLGTPGVTANPKTDTGGVKVFGHNLFPKLDFGLELLYGQDEQPMQLDQGPSFDDQQDVTVLGKVKRHF
jgi:hypothetical protein